MCKEFDKSKIMAEVKEQVLNGGKSTHEEVMTLKGLLMAMVENTEDEKLTARVYQFIHYELPLLQNIVNFAMDIALDGLSPTYRHAPFLDDFHDRDQWEKAYKLQLEQLRLLEKVLER